jgi:hypothetical protein
MKLKEALAEIERLRPYEEAFGRAWEVKTRFDRNNQPREIRVVFKVTTITGSSMADTVHKLLTDFNTNAANITP